MIKIAISGQIDNDTKVGYSYPHKFDPARPTPEDEWLHSVTDPRNARDFGVEEIFALWKSEHGNYYALIFPSKDDPRNGRMMITIHVENKVFSDGNVVVSTLRQLKSLVDQKWPNVEDSYIDVLTKDLENKLSRDYYAPLQESSNTKVYRVFKDEGELTAIMQFPNQSEYKPYKRVLIVPSSCIESAAQYIVNYKEIQGQIRVSYDINRPLPDGVSVDKYHYNYGDTITVKYAKSGYRSRQAKFCADGKSNKYAHFNGTEIFVNSAEEVGVQFDRGIKFEIKPKNSRKTIQARIEGLNCVYSNDSNNQNIIVFSNDLPEYQVRVSSSGFESEELILTEADFINGKVVVELVPKLNKISLKVEKEGKTIQGEVSVYSDDDLYPILVELQGYGKKLYTTQKNVEKVVSGGNRPGGGKTGSTNRGNGGYYGEDESSEGESMISKIWSWTKIPSIVVLAINLLYLIVVTWKTPWPFSYFDSKPTTTTSVVDPPSDPDPIQNNDKEVLNYMKAKDVWERSSMETAAKYVTLIDFISNRQIEESINHEYSTQTEVPCNGYWKGGKTSFVDIVNKLKTLGNYDYEVKFEIEDAMRKFATSSKVDLASLAKEVSVIANKYIKDSNADAGVTGSGTSGANGSRNGNASSAGSRNTGATSTGSRNGGSAGTGNGNNNGSDRRPTSEG